MSAEIYGEGRAASLMEVYEVKGSPQIHVHNLTSEQEFHKSGFARTELCCHGCGESVMVLFDKAAEAFKERNTFVEQHNGCRSNAGFDPCPNYRSKFTTKDVRLSMEQKPAHHPRTM